VAAARIGRFAPTPSGPLHIGSLLAAVGSWLDAGNGGLCHLRIDDLDTPRCRGTHETAILTALAACGLSYPQPPLHQSTRGAAYEAAIARLRERVPLFYCDCTRRELAAEAEACCIRDCARRSPDPANSSLRADLRGLEAQSVRDRSLGEIVFDPRLQRDLIVRRRDGLLAYHLACVVDDAAQGVTDVVRGADLLAGTPWQLALHQALALTPPAYLHLPLVVEADGQKLSKSRHAAPLDAAQATAALRQVLRWLGQDDPPANLGSAAAILADARDRWEPARFAGVVEVRLALADPRIL